MSRITPPHRHPVPAITLSATVRRLNDTGRPTYWVIRWAVAGLSVWALTAGGFPETADYASDTIGILGLTVVVAGLASLPCWIFMFFRGDPRSNRHGPPRKAPCETINANQSGPVSRPGPARNDGTQRMHSPPKAKREHTRPLERKTT